MLRTCCPLWTSWALGRLRRFRTRRRTLRRLTSSVHACQSCRTSWPGTPPDGQPAASAKQAMQQGCMQLAAIWTVEVDASMPVGAALHPSLLPERLWACSGHNHKSGFQGDHVPPQRRPFAAIGKSMHYTQATRPPAGQLLGVLALALSPHPRPACSAQAAAYPPAPWPP